MPFAPTVESDVPSQKPQPPADVLMESHPAPFGRPREFLGNRFVYAVISQRAYGLSIGINLNPDKACNFKCAYCEVNRDVPGRESKVDLGALRAELEDLLDLTFQGRLREIPYFHSVPDELLVLKEVALSGDGEPTLSQQFSEIVREVVHVRSGGRFPFFKLVLITNTTGLDLPQVQKGLKFLTSEDEIWAKLDAGSQEYLERVNGAGMSLDKMMANILLVSKQRPIVIQSLFPLLNGQEPPVEEIERYVDRLKDLKKCGAQISLVQVYSAHRPAHLPKCGHLRLRTLSRIARRVRMGARLRAEVF
ncbi:MAG: radical SAM protein [Verrucomicrobia bacterium]|nr:MAG: radical SAM protein [Verrucomicrobiota bacterium]